MSQEMMREASSASGQDLLRMFTRASTILQERAAAVDAINVFPVPDGDTGTNLLFTLQAAVQAASDEAQDHDGAPSTACRVSAAMARGALEKARGNSGMLLSQLFRGLSLALDGRESCGARELAAAFRHADSLARSSLAAPVEGTIITVYADVSRALGERRGHGGFTDALTAAVDAARRSVDRTPALMPLLRESGVVDAGAQGLLLVLEGALASRDSRDDAAPQAGSEGAVGTDSGPEPRLVRPQTASPAQGGAREGPAPGVARGGAARADPEAGWCTSFFLSTPSLSVAEVRSRMAARAVSVIVAGDERAVRVHAHTADPDGLLRFAGTIGSVSGVDIQDLAAGRGRTAIITDSVADIPPPLARELGITIVPLALAFGSDMYRDGVDLDSDGFYTRLRAGGEFPLTSAPSPAVFARAIDAAAAAADEVLVITLSSRLSGTYNAALQGRELAAAAPRVRIMDSGWAAMGQGFMVIEAARAARAGAGIGQAMAAARAAAGRVGFLAAFDTLEFLRRGGRIGAASALLGSLVRIHPLIHLKDGLVHPAGAAVSRRRAMDRLVGFARSWHRIDALAVENSACQEEADVLCDRLGSLFPRERILRTRMTPVIGAHTGPGLLVVAVMGMRRKG
jgi:uncharacterized protein